MLPFGNDALIKNTSDGYISEFNLHFSYYHNAVYVLLLPQNRICNKFSETMYILHPQEDKSTNIIIQGTSLQYNAITVGYTCPVKLYMSGKISEISLFAEI